MSQEYEVNPMKDTGDYIEIDKFKELLGSCNNDLERVFLIILWKTGRRVSEIVGGKVRRKHYIKVENKWMWDETYIFPICEGLRPKDIDYKNEQGHFWILKKVIKSDPMFIFNEPKPLDKEFLTILEEYIKSKGIGLDQRVIPRTRRWGNMVLNNLSKRTGVTTFSGRMLHNHAFRHSWNISAVRTPGSKDDLEHQRKIMGHSSIITTMSYAKFAQGEEKKLVDKMAEKDRLIESIKIDKSVYLEDKEIIPNSQGVYIFYSWDGIVLYVGRAENLRNRINQHFNCFNISQMIPINPVRIDVEIYKNPSLVKVIEIRHSYESEKMLIDTLKPLFNNCSIEPYELDAIKDGIPVEQWEEYKKKKAKETSEAYHEAFAKKLETMKI